MWQLQLTDAVLRTFNVEQRSTRLLIGQIQERLVTDLSPVGHFPFLGHSEQQTSQRTLEQTWTRKPEAEKDPMVQNELNFMNIQVLQPQVIHNKKNRTPIII